jgi:two-component system response regulator NreC
MWVEIFPKIDRKNLLIFAKNIDRMTDSPPLIQAIVVDDHGLFRIMLKATLDAHCPDIRIVAEAQDGAELFRLLAVTPADLILLDINLPGMSGVEIARRLHSDRPDIKILAISAENTAQTVESMIEAGINGFVSKQFSNIQELAQAIRTVVSGMDYFGRDIAAIIYELYVAKKKTTVVTSEFTEREREIILACRDGLLCKEIAEKMGISINTINTHKKRIFQKLGINTTIEMVQYALKCGIIRVEN